MSLSRAIVWMDSRQASVFRFGADDLARDQLRANKPFLTKDELVNYLDRSRIAIGIFPGFETSSSAFRPWTGRPMTGCSCRLVKQPVHRHPP